jgi:hypothetical protein
MSFRHDPRALATLRVQMRTTSSSESETNVSLEPSGTWSLKLELLMVISLPSHPASTGSGSAA